MSDTKSNIEEEERMNHSAAIVRYIEAIRPFSNSLPTFTRIHTTPFILAAFRCPLYKDSTRTQVDVEHKNTKHTSLSAYNFSTVRIVFVLNYRYLIYSGSSGTSLGTTLTTVVSILYQRS
ncbi:hypothetical protein EYC84_009582 [Monilinia fructicola]|uniref:Uncharacterized protein n=1 Tax=Monilinia fructicola TaxID=38448 RepID=A0A5M9JAE1_MONFR|nr:hypothetical protein EYC84_009582 [Monilinia fructicola]